MDWKQYENIEKGISIPPNWLFPYYYEALTLLFRIENALRMLVFMELKSTKGSQWLGVQIATADGEQLSIDKVAKKRRANDDTFGYLGHRTRSPLMYLTGGELVGLILSDGLWPNFKKYFSAGKQVVDLKLREIGTIRNILAHFRPISQDDVEVVKQNANQILADVESAIQRARCIDRVPSNYPDQWYAELKLLGTERTTLRFSECRGGEWVSICLSFKCAVLSDIPPNPQYSLWVYILNLNTPAILRLIPKLKEYVTFVSETIRYESMDENLTPNISKECTFVFSRSMMEEKYPEIKDALEELLSKVGEEADVITDDLSVRGDLIEVVNLQVQERKWDGGSLWIPNTSSLQSVVDSDHPPEYWGQFSIAYSDFVSDTSSYPWMPVNVSEGGGLPF